MIGGRGADLFVARADGGADSIADFADSDRLGLSSFGIGSFAALSSLFVQTATGVAIVGLQISAPFLSGVTVADLDPGDFIL